MNLVLLAGMPRSGTTAVGRMLALAKGARCLHEPFNYHVGLKQIERYFEIPGTKSFSTAQLDEILNNVEALNLQFKRGLFPEEKGWRLWLKSVAGGRAVNSYRACRFDPTLKTIIIKDPLASFTADHLAQKRGIEVLVMIRNPWAVAGSFKRMDWAFDIPGIVARLQEIGLDYSALLPNLSDPDSHPSVSNAAVLWNILYATFRQWQQHSERIHLFNLEDIVTDPILTYTQMYRLAGLELDSHVVSQIEREYGRKSERTQPREKQAHDRDRNLQSVNQYWTTYLTESEVALVERINRDIWEDCLQTQAVA